MEKLQPRGKEVTWLKGTYLENKPVVLPTIIVGKDSSPTPDQLVNNLINKLKP